MQCLLCIFAVILIPVLPSTKQETSICRDRKECLQLLRHGRSKHKRIAQSMKERIFLNYEEYSTNIPYYEGYTTTAPYATSRRTWPSRDEFIYYDDDGYYTTSKPTTSRRRCITTKRKRKILTTTSSNKTCPWCITYNGTYSRSRTSFDPRPKTFFPTRATTTEMDYSWNHPTEPEMSTSKYRYPWDRKSKTTTTTKRRTHSTEVNGYPADWNLMHLIHNPHGHGIHG